MITDENARKKLFLLIRMLSHFVGQTNLLKALHKYLKIYEYSNAGSQELLDLINDEVSWENVEVKEVMRSWVSQAGFPLITVTRDYKRGTLEVTQVNYHFEI